MGMNTKGDSCALRVCIIGGQVPCCCCSAHMGLLCRAAGGLTWPPPLPAPSRQATIVHLLLGAARGIAYIHSKGIIHGDVKPQVRT